MKDRAATREVPSCWWQWPFGCSAAEVDQPSTIAASAAADPWEEAEEVLRVERALRESIAGTNPSNLEEALRWAKAVVGVDRELLKLGRRQLPRMRLQEKLDTAMTGKDPERLENILSQASWLGVDAETLERARARLRALQVDWLPLHVIAAEDLEAAADPSAPASHRECTICMETYREYDIQAFLPCCHRFHAKCAKSWLATRSECPVCSYPVCGDDAMPDIVPLGRPGSALRAASPG